MSKILTLKIPDSIFEKLIRASARLGQTPEQVVLTLVEKNVEQSDHDPLLQLAGAFESNLTDISQRHDDYIGKASRANGD